MENQCMEEIDYRNLVDNSGGGLTMTEILEDGTLVNLFTSNGMLRLMHVTRDEWDAHPQNDLFAKVYPEDAEKAKSIFDELREDGEIKSEVYRLNRFDGGYTWVNVTGTCSIQNGKTIIYTVHTDITKQKESEEKEIKAKKQLESVLSSTTGGICAYFFAEEEHAYQIAFANKSYYDIFGYTKEQFNQEVKSTLDLVYPKDLPQVQKQISKAFSSDLTQSLEYRCYKRDGSIIWVSVNSRTTNIFGYEKKVLLCETVDITAHKQMETETSAMVEQISFLNKAAGDLLIGTDGTTAFDVVLKDIRQYFDGQRAYIFEFDTNNKSACNTYEVCASTAQPAIDLLQDVPYSSFYTWFTIFEKEGYIAISDVSQLGEDRIVEKGLLEVQHISSLIVVPLKLNDEIIGMMGVDDPTKNVDQMPRLQAIGDYISVMISRRNLNRELNENNIRMNAMMNDTPGGFVQMIIHEDNSVTPEFINDGFCLMLQMTQKECHTLFDEDAYAGVHIDDKKRVSELLDNTIQKRAETTTRVRLQTGNGTYLPVEAHYRVWENPNGNLFLNGYYRNISEELAKEDEYRRNLAYRDINGRDALASFHINVTRNIIDDGVSIVPEIKALSEDGTIDSFIDHCSSMQLEQENHEFVALFSREALLFAMDNGKNQITYEHAVLVPGKSILWICTTADLFRNPDTNDVEGFIYDRDLSEQHLLHQMMTTVVDVSFDFVVAINVKMKSYRTFIANKDVVTAFKHEGVYDSDKTIKELLSIVYTEDKEKAKSSMNLENMIHELKSRSYSEFHYRLMINNQISYKRCAFAYLDENKEFILLSRVDETETVEQLHLALEEAKSASKAKTTFLSNMSHEIRTPMNAIIGLTQLVLDDMTISGETRKNLDGIRDSSDYLLGIINDILDMSRIESGKFNLKCEWVPVNAVMNQCVEMMIPSMESKHIHFEYPPNMKTVNYEYYIDEMKTKQMIMNILNNAYKFTKEGGHVSIRVQNKQRDDQQCIDQIIIEDTGCGMSKEFLTHLFEPFAQERTSSDSIQGTGLGLTLARQTARAMGGDITVESEIGKGSKFIIEFPYRYRKSEVHTFVEERIPLDYHDKLINRYVLLCEDNHTNTVIAQKLLEKEGCIVDTAENGMIGLDKFTESKEFEYDAILMDIRMPIMDGLKAAEKIRSSARKDAKDIPIIAMSANAFSEDIQASLDAGMNAHLTKPVEPEKMYQVLAEQIGKRG